MNDPQMEQPGEVPLEQPAQPDLTTPHEWSAECALSQLEGAIGLAAVALDHGHESIFAVLAEWFFIIFRVYLRNGALSLEELDGLCQWALERHVAIVGADDPTCLPITQALEAGLRMLREDPEPEVYDFTPSLAQRSANDTDRMQRLNAGTNASVNRHPDSEEQKLMDAVAANGDLSRQNASRNGLAARMPRPGRANNTLSLADLAGSTRTIQLRNLTPQQQQELTALKARFPGRDAEIENTYLNNL